MVSRTWQVWLVGKIITGRCVVWLIDEKLTTVQASDRASVNASWLP